MSTPWTAVAASVEQLLGLHYPPERFPDLKRGLKGAASELGFESIEACARELLSPGLDAVGLEALAGHLTIGETYFFRGDETFAALERRILPELIDRRRKAGNLRLRIWSAACCTGEEAYSLAILLRRLLPDVDDWSIDLRGTDLNPRFLRKAREGVYRSWSFRGTTPDFTRRYFCALPGGRHEVRPEIRRMVGFSQMNLVDAAAQARVREGAFDLVLCRNVLMYFTPAQAASVVRLVHGSLAADGWLAVAPCEVSQALFARFETVHHEGALFHRKACSRRARSGARVHVMPLASHAPAEIAARSRRPVPRTTPPTRPVAPRAVVAAAPLAVAVVVPRAAPPARAVPAAEAAVRARAMADQGRTGEALGWCERWIDADRLDAAAHYMRGMILAERGDTAEACLALERSLYLAPEGVMATLALANLERGRGRERQAGRHYRNLLETLERLPPDAVIDQSEGISVRQMAALVCDLATHRKQA